jgi:Lrp/AsnC family transcriptional regulator, leucine-responsive regulatory protein
MKMKRNRSDRELDHFDTVLLNIVQENNLLTSDQLAGQVGLSATACQRRLKRLRADGVISADVSLVAPEALGAPVTLVVLVSLEREQLDLLDGFKRRIANYPEVTQCYYVTGSVDFIMVVRVASMEAYGAFTERAFFGDKNIKAFQTFATMQTVKFTTKFHIEG